MSTKVRFHSVWTTADHILESNVEAFKTALSEVDRQNAEDHRAAYKAKLKARIEARRNKPCSPSRSPETRNSG